MVREAWREVQDVAWLKHPSVGWLKLLEEPDRKVRDEVILEHRAVFNHPLTLAGCLDEEDVKVVDVSANVSPVVSVAHHDVIHAPEGDE